MGGGVGVGAQKIGGGGGTGCEGGGIISDKRLVSGCSGSRPVGTSGGKVIMSGPVMSSMFETLIGGK